MADNKGNEDDWMDDLDNLSFEGEDDAYMEEDEDLLYLIDEDGNTLQFEFLESVEMDGKTYAILLPVEEDEEYDGDVFIFEMVPSKEDPDIEEFNTIEDEETVDRVFEVFREKFQDVYNFED